MKVLFGAVLVVAVGTSICAWGQAAVESGTLGSSVSMSANSVKDAGSKVADRLADVASKAGTAETAKPAAHTPSVNTSPGSKTIIVQSSDQVRPTPPAIFVLANGEKIESSRYTLLHDSVRLMDKGRERTIQTSALNMPSTMAVNHDRGLDLKFPQNNAQITLGF